MTEVAHRQSLRFLLLLIATGMAGVASMAFAPIERLLPAGADVPRALLLLQPALFVALCGAMGWWATPRLGLDAPVLEGIAEGGDWAKPLRGMLMPALVGGLACGLCIALFGTVAGDLLNGRAQAIELPLATRAIYGGTVEEIIFRWALMPLLALGLCRLSFGRGAALWIANVAAAFLFAAGHVPGIMMAVADQPYWLVPVVLVANTTVGVICGWLFMRRGFEAAMIAHAAAHPFSVLLLALLA